VLGGREVVDHAQGVGMVGGGAGEELSVRRCSACGACWVLKHAADLGEDGCADALGLRGLGYESEGGERFAGDVAGAEERHQIGGEVFEFGRLAGFEECVGEEESRHDRVVVAVEGQESVARVREVGLSGFEAAEGESDAAGEDRPPAEPGVTP